MRVLQTAIRQNSLRDYVAPLEQPPEIRIFIGRRASPPLRGGTHAGGAYGQKQTIAATISSCKPFLQKFGLRLSPT